ncbi:MAG: hypothetical protein ACLP1X_33000 [Polyangiaceae bacterium]
MDLSHLEPYFERNRFNVPEFFIETDGGAGLYNGSGTLVTLGDREFILTAGHNVWDKDKACLATIAVGRAPDGLVMFIKPGDGSAGRVLCPPPGRPGGDPEPDVAVVEPTGETILARGRQPFTEEEIAFFDTNRVTVSGEHAMGLELVATGFPTQEVVFRAGHPLSQIGTPLVSTRVCTIPVTARPKRFEGDPAEGRCVHVHISRRQEDTEGTVSHFVKAEGFSGGPIVAPEGRGGMLVGLMRGVFDFEEGWDMWCEPAAEAVRLLVDHEDARVAAAARRVCERYDEARAKGPKRVTLVPRVA